MHIHRSICLLLSIRRTSIVTEKGSGCNGGKNRIQNNVNTFCLKIKEKWHTKQMPYHKIQMNKYLSSYLKFMCARHLRKTLTGNFALEFFMACN